MKTQAACHVPHLRLGVRCSKAKESPLTSAAPPPHSAKRQTRAPRAGIPTAVCQRIENHKIKQGSVTDLQQEETHFTLTMNILTSYLGLG